jgi:hypothetical protein
MSIRRKILQSIAAGGLLAWVNWVVAAGNKPLPPGMRKIKGEVSLNGQRAREGQMVLQGETVTTGPGSEAIYVMAGNAYLIRENSKISYFSEGAVNVMRVITGKVLSVFAPGQKRIETPTATLGIRGTGCYIEAEEDQVYFCLCYGAVDLIPVADTSQQVSYATEHHEKPLYISGDLSKPLVQTAPVQGHRDWELIMLERTVGRKTPFEGKDFHGY